MTSVTATADGTATATDTIEVENPATGQVAGTRAAA